MVRQKLILIGSGLSHLNFLKEWSVAPLKDWQVIWITGSQSYLYPQLEMQKQWGETPDSSLCNWKRIAEIAKIRHVESEVESIDANNRIINFKSNHPSFFYDRISIDATGMDIFGKDSLIKKIGCVAENTEHSSFGFVPENINELEFLALLESKRPQSKWTVFTQSIEPQLAKNKLISQWLGKQSKVKDWGVERDPLGVKKTEFVDLIKFESLEKSIQLWCRPFISDYFCNHGWQFFDQEISVAQRPFHHLVDVNVVKKYSAELFKALNHRKMSKSFRLKRYVTSLQLVKGKKIYSGDFLFFINKKNIKNKIEIDKLFSFFNAKGSSRAEDFSPATLSEPKAQNFSLAESENRPQSFTFGGNFSLIDDPYLLGEMAACRALSECYARGIEPQSSEWFLSHSADYQNEDIRHFYCGVEEILEKNHVKLVQAQSFVSQNMSWFAHFIHSKVEAAVFENKIEEGDVLVMTSPIGFSTLWSQQMREQMQSQWFSEGLQNLNKDMSQAFRVAKKFNIKSVKVVGSKGFSGACLECLDTVPELKALINMRKMPRYKGVSQLITRDPKWISPQAQINWNDLRLRVNFEAENISEQNDCLWEPELNGGWLIVVEKTQALLLVKELRKVGFLQAQVVGCVGRKSNSEKLALSDWEPEVSNSL